MGKSHRLWAIAALAAFNASHAQVIVTTYHNDAVRSGQNIQESILTPANVNSNQFGKLFSVAVDGRVYAQPLYLSGVNIAGGTHNVVYVATEHDSVYAIDADSGTVYSQVSLIPAGGTTLNSASDLGAGCTDLVPEVGITGTPVIDPTSGTLYVVAVSKVNGVFYQYLHALDVTSLQEKLNGPVSIQATVAGSGYDSSGGVVTFNHLWSHQRAALLLDGGHVLISWGSHCDYDPWHGWVMSYNAGTLAQEAAFNSSPNDSHNGIWMSGSGPAADSAGNIYFATGNGSWNGTTDFGDSIVKLGPPAGGQFPVLDYFTPYNQGTLNADDTDVASGGLLVLPPLPSGLQLLAQQGKQGTVYLLNTDNLGKYCVNLTPACTGNDPQIVQEIKGATAGIWGSPAYWNGNLYWGGSNEPLEAFSFNAGGSGLISTSPTSQSAVIFSYPGSSPSVSANGATNGIVWAQGSSTLYAYDATNLKSLLYTSNQAANNRDATGATVKFVPPIIANGKVYLGTQSALVTYGLLDTALPVAASPSLSPPPGSYTVPQSVTLSDTTPGAVIYYTTNGTAPTLNSAQYSPGTPLQISSTTTVEAMAVASGYQSSPVTNGAYTINAQGTSSISVSLGSVEHVDGIANTGTAPAGGGLDTEGYAYSATLLGASLNWGGSTFTLGAAGIADAVSSTTIALPAGNDSTLNILATSVNGAQLAQTFVVTYTDGTTSTFKQSLSDWFYPQTFAGESQALKMAYRITPAGATSAGPVYLYGYSFALNSAKTVQSLTLPTNRNVVVLAVDVSPTGSGTPPTPAASPTLTPAPGSYTSTQSVTLTDTTPGAVIYYTTNGAAPSVNSTQYSPGTPVAISSTTTLEAIAVASGYSNSAASGGTYTIGSQGTTPVSVALATVDVDAIANTGTAPAAGGLDTDGYAYSATLLGASLNWGGSTFTLGAAGIADAVSSTTIALPAGNDSTLNILATAVNGAQTGQSFVVTYTDGTTSTFKQNLSDWFYPQNFAGESQALKMAYRIAPSGATSAGPVYLYGYSFALNSAKTVQSLTLPTNRNVVVLAVDVSPTGSAPPLTPAASPTLSPPPGSYTSTQSVTLADTTPGAVIYYTTNGTAPTLSSAQYSPGTPVSISSTTTLEAIAVASGYSNSAASGGTYTIGSQGSTPISVVLAAVDVDGIANTGTAPAAGGLDTEGYAYSATLLGTSLSWGGSSFALGAAGVDDAVSSTPLALPAGSDSTLSILATAVNGAQTGQSFVVTYTDGTTSTFKQNLSDWFYPQNFAGESQALKMAYRIAPSGATSAGPVYLYGYSFALNSAKTVQSLALPNNRNVVVFAVDLTP